MRAKGFTLVELLVAVVLTAVGIVAMIGALSGMTRAQTAVNERDTVFQLAQEKYDEVIATGAYETETGGEFEGEHAGRYSWTLEVLDTGTESLQSVRLTVAPTNGTGRQAMVEGLIMTPPETTAPAGGAN